jgi:putative PIN family toxin of toxin-antitoxin system
MRLIYMALDGEVEIAVSEPIIKEVLRVLRDKYEMPPCEILAASQRMEGVCRIVNPTDKLAVLGEEPDNRILECAKAGASQYIITEDKLMLRLKEFEGAKIIRLTDFLREIQPSRRR